MSTEIIVIGGKPAANMTVFCADRSMYMKQMIYKYEYVNELFKYIEENISDELETTLLSKIGYVARDKLYKDFYSVCGHTVKEYIRKRRLSNALALIKMSDMGFTDIAFQCGYSSHQALCRAIKQNLGLTPSEYKNGNVYYFFPPFSGVPLYDVTVLKNTIPSTFRVLFYSKKLSGIENTAINTFFKAIPDYSGRIFGRNGDQKGDKFCYELHLSDTARDYSALINYGFRVTYEVSSIDATFAMVSVRNNENVINAAWDYLYSEWLQKSMFEYTNEPYYEEYILKNREIVRLKLYLPVQCRAEITKITLINDPSLRFIAAKGEGYNAEKTASAAIIDFFISNYPYMLATPKELYLQKEINSCICGVKVSSQLPTVKDKNIIDIVTEQSYYLVLESTVMGDYYTYADMMLSFAVKNGVCVDKNAIFAVYEAEGSYKKLKIKMYCPIKSIQNDKKI